jgi:hypothetical protein
MAAVPLFISYAHEEEKWLNLLTTHLASLENDGLIEVWDDREIRAASEKTWEAQLLPRLESAGIVVIILSPDFAKSRYCQEVELPRAIARKERRQALVFFVLARPYAIEQSIRRFQILPKASQSLKQLRDRDAALTDVVEQIRAAIEEVPRVQPPALYVQALTQRLPPYLPYRATAPSR